MLPHALIQKKVEDKQFNLSPLLSLQPLQLKEE
jgi:hypothetical protein